MADFSAIPTDQLAYLLVERLNESSHHAHQARLAEEYAGRVRAALRARLIEGEAIVVDEDTIVVLEPAKPNGRRSVNVDGVHRHIETLGPLGLGPETVMKETFRYPTVAELTRRQAQLEREGIPLDDLVSVPPLGEPQVVVQQRKAVEA